MCGAEVSTDCRRQVTGIWTVAFDYEILDMKEVKTYNNKKAKAPNWILLHCIIKIPFLI